MAGGPKDSSELSRLTPLQIDLLEAFFAREQRYVLTGGAALAGFYFGHRETEDLDFFGTPGLDLQEAARTLEAACAACAAAIESVQTFPDFRRYLATRARETCIVDLVIDRVLMLDAEKRMVGHLRIDTIREIAANKICTVLGRAQIKDLVDLKFLLASGIDLSATLADAARKDAGVDAATLAWVLDQITISPDARLPGGTDPVALDEFRCELVNTLQRLAFAQTPGPR
ncbi:MAG TPA: nucleotidyl transferase AbiEii/AbiGii toxin family protein [Polyangia bacterium]|jgi:Domain of unknown function (DUF1814).|nr:nucleotidyl transferase AbiEii/AbiGii toxin family protein [Polyangia bacterium]